MRQLRNHFGFGMIEALVAGAIVSVAAVGLGTAINTMGKSRQKTQSVNQVISLESVILEALQNSETYMKPAYITSLQNRNLSDFRAQFSIPAPGWGDGTIALTGPTGNIRYNADGSICAGCTNWVSELHFDIRETSLPADPPNYAFAYSIQVNPDVISIPAMGMPYPFSAASYSIPVPMKSLQSGQGCDPLTEVGMTGYNFDTGESICLQKPQQDCPAGFFAVGLRAFPVGDPSPVSLEYECQKLQSVDCPAGYALSDLKPSLLDLRNAAQPVTAKAVCTFMGKEQEPSSAGTVSAESEVSGTFCQKGYDAVITRCQGFVARTSQTPQVCPIGAPVLCPYIQDGAWFGVPATYAGSPVYPTIPSTANSRAIGSRPGGRNTASCRLNNPAQPSGAGWTGYVEMEVRCDRKTPGVGGVPADWGYPRTALPTIVAD